MKNYKKTLTGILGILLVSILVAGCTDAIGFTGKDLLLDGQGGANQLEINPSDQEEPISEDPVIAGDPSTEETPLAGEPDADGSIPDQEDPPIQQDVGQGGTPDTEELTEEDDDPPVSPAQNSDSADSGTATEEVIPWGGSGGGSVPSPSDQLSISERGAGLEFFDFEVFYAHWAAWEALVTKNYTFQQQHHGMIIRADSDDHPWVAVTHVLDHEPYYSLYFSRDLGEKADRVLLLCRSLSDLFSKIETFRRENPSARILISYDDKLHYPGRVRITKYEPWEQVNPNRTSYTLNIHNFQTW
jgi:hypothetical protein